MSRGSLTTGLTLAGVAALSALTMYFFDPARGRHRRALCMDQLTGAANTVKDAVGSKARDQTNRAKGALAEARSAVESGPPRERETAGGELEAA